MYHRQAGRLHRALHDVRHHCAARRPREVQGARVVALTGAGISAESGVPTFRDAGGLWRKYRVEELATPEALRRDPRTVWEWYDHRRSFLATCEPNPAHRALAQFFLRRGAGGLITQNVDGLHTRAALRRRGMRRRMARCRSNDGVVARDRCNDWGFERRGATGQFLSPCGECGGCAGPMFVLFGEGSTAPRSRAPRAMRRSGGLAWSSAQREVYPAPPYRGPPASGRVHHRVNTQATSLTARVWSTVHRKAGDGCRSCWGRTRGGIGGTRGAAARTERARSRGSGQHPRALSPVMIRRPDRADRCSP